MYASLGFPVPRRIATLAVLMTSILALLSQMASGAGAQASAHGIDEPSSGPRTYEFVGACGGAGRDDTHGAGYEGMLTTEMFEYSCSDGSTLYYTVDICGTARGATKHLRAQARGDFVTKSRKTKYGYLARYRIAIEVSCLGHKDRPLRYELYWNYLNKVYSILGPSPTHILELKAANPNRYW
jgi:hypothetical protein